MSTLAAIQDTLRNQHPSAGPLLADPESHSMIKPPAPVHRGTTGHTAAGWPNGDQHSAAAPRAALSAEQPDIAEWRDATLRRSPNIVWQARQTIRFWLADANPDLLYNVALAASELVTNVIRHVPAGVQRDWVKMRLGAAAGFVRLEVIDPGTTLCEPQFTPLALGSLQESGRGLDIVAGLAIRCGTERIGSGPRLVWAELTTQP
ncbi:ATP-binding protein [Nonomuraea fuscirosea]